MVVNELNNEYGSLFQEKKYKELLTFAKEQQAEQLEVFGLQVSQLFYITKELAQLSRERSKLLNSTTAAVEEDSEESKVEEKGDLIHTFKVLSQGHLVSSYLNEL